MVPTIIVQLNCLNIRFSPKPIRAGFFFLCVPKLLSPLSIKVRLEGHEGENMIEFFFLGCSSSKSTYRQRQISSTFLFLKCTQKFKLLKKTKKQQQPCSNRIYNFLQTFWILSYNAVMHFSFVLLQIMLSLLIILMVILILTALITIQWPLIK